MTVTINLPAETERKLQELAAQAGQSIEGFIQHLVEREVRQADGVEPAPSADAEGGSAVHPGMTFDEILAPVRAGFAESGLSEEELESLLEEAREEVWQERQRQEGPE